MEDTGTEFPGFQTCAHKDDSIFRRRLSRLQRRAPYPLQLIKQPNNNNASSSGCTSSSNNSSSSSLNSFIYQSKDPIPLLSPLVLPSLLESAYIQQVN
ncbi:hypothetical protein RchiOBHm_Chr4g0437411 [Rosa chinensis]|uniref:Uncharacterized protein n=1 Tax=Rosa chinensis TaxID=74649 RepID=A0A2P6R2B2_ROSCH|nr:hypothetical protein RchiOBHm_Chr4g0437411 [Rosa chinensis]